MANYLFLKESSEPVKVGDLTQNGIHELICDHWNGVKLTPLLIMDAPEHWPDEDDIENYPLPLEFDEREELKQLNLRKSNLERKDDELKESAIPFHSNEQVYNWLKSKGIKPEPDMLIEFDGEVLFWKDCLGFGAPTTYEFFKERKCGICWNNCKQYAIMDIQPPEVKQESEEMLWHKAMMTIIDVERELGSSEMEIVEKLKQHFKIERRK